MSADEFRMWVANLVVAALVTAAVVLGFPDWPMWAFIVIAVVSGIMFPIVPVANKKADGKS